MQKARVIFEKPAAQIIMSLAVALLSLPVLPISAQAEEASLPPLTLSAEAIRNEGLRVVPVTRGTLAHSVPAMARVLPDTTRTVTLHTAGDGKVLSVLVLPGQNVKTGQPLVTYQNHTLHLARLQAAQTRAALAAARADQANASAAYDRARALAGTTVSVGEMRRRLAVLKETQNAVATHEAELGVLAHRLQEEYTSPTEQHGEDETSTIISPVDGTITQVETAVAADVAPPQPLLTVSDTAHVWIVSDVPPQDAQMLVSGGRQKTFLPPAGDAPSSPAVQSTIETIETAADPATGLVRVLSRVANPTGHLRPGMMLNSLLQTTQTGTGLLVPAQAVQNIGGQTVVFVQTAPEHFQPTPVRTGMEESDTTLVLSGLKQGDQVVSDGSLALKAMVILPGMDAD